MKEIVPQTKPIDPVLLTLATAMRIQFADDAAACRAIDRALEIVKLDLPYEFDGVELRVVSSSRRKEGIWQVTDGCVCTCEGNRFAWCRHRAFFRLLLARMVITDPTVLRVKILAQLAPLDEPPGDFLDSIDSIPFDEYGDIAPPAPFRPRAITHEPAASSDWARAQAACDELFAA